jgi:hypothetical protein
MPLLPAAQNASGPDSVEAIRALLIEALSSIDALQLSPEIGARLQHVIDTIDQRTTKPAPGDSPDWPGAAFPPR